MVSVYLGHQIEGSNLVQTGVDEELGVIPCAVDGVFDAINAVRHCRICQIERPS
jgi:hypothetical protein